MGSTSVSVITPQEVLESLMNDGTIDAIRLKIINHLKANEQLKNSTITMVEESKVLNSPGAEKHTKRELFDALRQELEVPALEKASKAVWELILDNDGIGKEINGTVERVFCRLSGREPPLFPPLITQVETHKVEENEDEIEGGEKETERGEKETESLGKEKEDEGLDTSVKKKMKKRKRSVRVEKREVAVGSGDSPSVRDDSVPRTRTVSAGCEKSVETDTRCRRTDGKSWRCTKDCAPDQKYCEKHMYRGKARTDQKTNRGKTLKKQVKSTNQATSSNNMVDSSPDIPSSSPS